MFMFIQAGKTQLDTIKIETESRLHVYFYVFMFMFGLFSGLLAEYIRKFPIVVMIFIWLHISH